MEMKITTKILENQVSFLNKLTDSPNKKFTKINNESKGNLGHFYLEYAVGNISLLRICSENGSSTIVFDFCSNQMMFSFIKGFIAGFNNAK
jgi:hypothetical protein